MRRLTRAEYVRLLEDILGVRYANVPLPLADRLPTDPQADAPVTDGDLLAFQTLHLKSYADLAERAVAALGPADRPPAFVYRVDPRTLTRKKIYGDREGFVGAVPADDPVAGHPPADVTVGVPDRTPGGASVLPPVYRVDNYLGRDKINVGSWHVQVPYVKPVGVLRLTIRAGAVIPPGEGAPVLRVALHNNVINQIYGKEVASFPVANPADALRDYEVEVPLDLIDFPWAMFERTGRLSIRITNDYAPLADRAKPSGEKGKAAAWPWDEPRLVIDRVTVEGPGPATGRRGGRRRRPRSTRSSACTSGGGTPGTAGTPPSSPRSPPPWCPRSPCTPSSGGPTGPPRRPPPSWRPGWPCSSGAEARTPNCSPPTSATRPSSPPRPTGCSPTPAAGRSPRTSSAGPWPSTGSETDPIDFGLTAATFSNGKVAAVREARLKRDLAAEPVRYFEHLLAGNRPVPELLGGGEVVANDRVAAFYGIPGVSGGEFRPVPAPPDRRGGWLTMAGVVAAASRGNAEATIHRGAYLLDRLLGEPPGTPPGVVEPLEAQAKADAKRGKLPIREQVRLHTAVNTCQLCHRKIDPLGFVWADLDHTGRPAARAGRQPAAPSDCSGALPDGRPFADRAGFLALVRAGDPAGRYQFPEVFVRRLAGYALGRPLTLADEDAARGLVDVARRDGWRLRGVIKAIVLSRPFTHGP
ncbi:MAG: hypothetical protein C0501_28005 [Isosphaera sp.]|nr:hypothetical protein [Isosphaera sp.]